MIRLTFMMLLLSTNIEAVQPDFITNAHARESTDLSGKWKYIIDQYEEGKIGFNHIYKNLKPTSKLDRIEYSFDDASALWVPGSWNAQQDKLYHYEGTIWYRKEFNYQRKLKNSRVFAYFAGANYKADVSINGNKLGSHEGGFTPFSFEITKLLNEKDNFIIVGVSNRREKNHVPGLVTDWYNYGGITRDVKIIEVPMNYIDNFTIYLDKGTLAHKNKHIKGSIQLTGEQLPTIAIVTIPELKIKKKLTVDKQGMATFDLAATNLTLWHPDHPKLYDVTISAGEDSITDRIGFRTIETQGKKILLNGKSIFLKGVSLHDENPLREDRANSIEDARIMLGWVKEMNGNFARLAHYPHQENIMRLADEMGILLWEELPLYWGIDWTDDKVLAKAKMQYAEMIRRDKNRAATIIWSIANETWPSDARNNFLTEIAHHVRSLDATRLLSGASKKDRSDEGEEALNFTVSDPIGKEFDIISFNEYQGWYDGSPLLCRDKNFKVLYDKPVIISEFGAGAIAGFHADENTRWSEEFQSLVYRENLKMFDRIEGLAGLSPWVLADFQSPLRQLPSVQDGWNRKGLISERGKKKQAFYIMKEHYKNK